MKTVLRSLGRILAIAAFVFAGMTARADLSLEQLKALRAQAFTTAQTDALAGAYADAEQALASLVFVDANTASWHFSLAQQLTQLAGNLASAGKPIPARAIATRALQQLAQADPLTSDTTLKAAIQQASGVIAERYLGDIAAAKAYYRSAAQLMPANASAQENADRLEAADNKARGTGN